MGKVLENKNDSFGNNSIIIDETEIAYISLSKPKTKKKRLKKFSSLAYHNA